MIIALVPAYNEQDYIAATITALRAQTVPPDRIITIADNCTDNTELLAKEAGSDVLVTQDNTSRKAGALNYALRLLLPELDDSDYVFVQDADTVIVPDFLRLALACMAEPDVVVCGRYAANYSRNPLVVLQRNEFARDGRMTGRREERTHILVGTSTLFPVYVLRDVHQARMDRKLPGGRCGYVYREDSITEDFDLTLVLKTLGYRTFSPNGAEAITDPMDTVPKLWNQRLRWARGGIEDLHRFGWNKVTAEFHLRRAYIVFGILALALFSGTLIAAWVTTSVIETSLPWMMLTLVFLVDRIIQVRRAGRLSMAYAAVMIPEITYNLFHQVIYVVALVEVFTGRKATWKET